MKMTFMNGNRDKQWYCIETVNEELGVHNIIITYATEAEATLVLRAVDKRLPQEIHIYYWRSKERPVSRPPKGYAEGPTARPDGPSKD